MNPKTQLQSKSVARVSREKGEKIKKKNNNHLMDF